MIELSVHLLTYNSGKHIEETLLSILKQNVDFNYEIVVGDDCSTDNTLEIIKQYSTKHPKLFKIKKNESQLGILRNFKATLDRCSGHYIFDIAGDDLFKSEFALQKMVDILKHDDSLGFVDSGSDKLFVKKNTVKSFYNQETLKLSKEAYLDKILLGQAASIGVCFNKKHLYNFVDFDYYINQGITIEDYPIIVDLAMNTNFERIKESLHIYRVHEASYSQKKSFESHYCLKQQMRQLFDFYTEKYNLNKGLIDTFNSHYYKELLFLTGYFEEKQLGKDTYKMIPNKSIKDYIHFWASQNSLFRKLVSII
ncbi:glycosyltransferase family 2 protein [Algibacter miyuki]|uniref:Glycosyltransferase family 2 protein n=1 Tax=Algibacter miyuki TaxID=1306933 RepID=A0ABV5GXM1_9FLAO|nr:glycosyltransferase family 2 protein [Algibacter miyuki]MDN3665902.1 glycosyltransferase family 2 protein [Algibacter miyuki]